METTLTSHSCVSICTKDTGAENTKAKRCINGNWLALWLIIFSTLFYPLASRATITIAAVSTTGSTCVNNGTAYVSAYSIPASSLLYAIIAGPITAQIQSNPYFPSLFPGNYTVRVYDNNFDSTDAQFVITGNYQTPTLTPIVTNPTCPSSTDGRIIGNIDSATGMQPYTWDIISPYYIPPTSGDTFTNLQANTYQLRMTDACGNYQTRTVTLTANGTDLGYWQAQYYTFPSVSKIGCDTIAFTFWFTMDKDSRNLPLKLSINTWDTSYVKNFYATVFDSINFTPAWMEVRETIPNMTYGDYLNVCVIDTCGIQICSYLNQIAPFNFVLQYYNSGTGCNAKIGANAMIYASPYANFDYTAIKGPGTIIFRDIATNTILYSDSCSSYCSFVIPPQISGRNYELTITDGCGQAFQQTYLWPSIGTPAVQPSAGPGCIDSTATGYFNCQNFQSQTTFEFISGPRYAHSSKPGYAFSDTITYPIVYTGVNPNGAAISTMPEGTYQYRVSDSCGNTVTGIFEVLPTQLSDFSYTYHIKRGCLGNNTLYYDATSSMTVASMITNATTGQQVYLRTTGSYSYDSVLNVQPGKYAITIWYGQSPWGGGVYNYNLSSTMPTCWALHDTITVYPYDNSTFQSTTTIKCNGISYVEINVDSSKGVPSYQYEIMSGPQTFPLQDSGLFQINGTGTYVIRIRDACANSNIQQFTIDTAAIAPIVKRGILCVGSKVTLASASSPYFTYDWRKPNGTHYTGDTLTINPFTLADTGLYRITKYVHINGCTDTFATTYHLTTRDSFPQTVIVCSGDTLNVGTKKYTQTGIYRDTLRSQFGCDSIIISNLTVLMQTTTIHDTTICIGEQIVVGNHIYNTSGAYRDSIAVASCYQIIVTNLTVLGTADTITQTICSNDTLTIGMNHYTISGTYNDTLVSSLGCDSVVVTQLTVLLLGSALIFNICPGDSVAVGNNVYYTSGVHIDTVTSSSGCDSVLFTVVNFLPIGRDTINKQICNGGSYTFAGHTLTATGTYYDTIPSSVCDSIVMLNLTVSTYLTDTIRRSICTGYSYNFNGTNYSTAGNYNDTVTGPICDSIITLLLTVTPSIAATASGSVCPGHSYSYNGTSYTQPGTYRDTVHGISCDTVFTLTLTRADYLRDTISQTICSGQSYSVGNANYTQTGTYTDTIATTTCDSIIILNLTVQTPSHSFINHTICSGDTIHVGNSVYTQTGAYVDTIATAGCDSIVTLILSVKPSAASLVKDTICEGKAFDFHGEMLNAAGTYMDTLTSINGCDSIVTLQLATKPNPIVQILASSHSVHAGDTVRLSAVSTETLSYYWNGDAIFNSITNPNILANIDNQGWIYLTATSFNTCSTIDSLLINLLPDSINCEHSGIHVPNAFSPNGDNANDVLKLFGNNVTLNTFKIYNRWGELVFQTEDINVGWDGTYKGELMPPDVYVYYATFSSCKTATTQFIKGSVTIFR